MFDQQRLLSLPEADISVPSAASATPFLVTAQVLGIAADRDSLLDYLSSNRDAVRDYLERCGALYFRGFDLNGAADFQDTLIALGYDLLGSNFGGASPRPRVRDKVFLSTAAPGPFIIGYHTEFVYQQRRPGMIAFYCEQAPERYGETPFFDCARVYDSLGDALKEKLETLGVRYYRRFYGKRSPLNFRKTWSEVFDTNDKSVVETYLREEGADFQWLDDDSLVTELSLPAIVTDPLTKRKMLSVTMFTGESFAYNFWHFRERYSWATRYLLSWFVHRETRPGNRFLFVTLGDSTPFTRAECEEIQQACWRNAIISRWREKDFVLLNNKRWAHGRLNVGGRRKIIVAMGDQFDVRAWQANTALT